MTRPTTTPISATTLEREWGRLRRGQLMHQLRASSEPGQTPLELELLRAVNDAGETRASDLASRLFVTKTSISRYVNGMLRRDLLVQRPDPTDGRATLLSVSATGRRALARREARRSAVLHDLCADWPRGDVEMLTLLLQRLNDGIEGRLVEETKT